MLLIAATTSSSITMFTDEKLSNSDQRTNTAKFFENTPPNQHNDKVARRIEWLKPEGGDWENGLRLVIKFKVLTDPLQYVTWHYKGDYFASVCPSAHSQAVYVHQLSRQQTQNPFKKQTGEIQKVLFHPSKPFFFIATQRQVKIYNLAQQSLTKKLLPGVNWISSLDVHPGGDNVIVGSYDCKVCWFDLDLSVKPYKHLRYHKFAIRATKYHRLYPLFASCSDDGQIHVFHGMVYNDLLQNPFIVPLKILKGHEVVDDLGVLDIVFHPTQPWLFSAGADKTIRLYL